MSEQFEEIKKLELLSEKSRYILEKQIQEIRYMGSKAVTIVGVGSIFFPLIIYIFDKLKIVNNSLLIISLTSFTFGIFCLTFVLISSKTFIGYKEDDIDKLIKETTKEIHIYEIRGNKGAIKENRKKIERLKLLYNGSTWMINISIIIISISLISSILNSKEDINMKDNNEIKKDKPVKKEDSPSIEDSSNIFIPLDKDKLNAVDNVIVIVSEEEIIKTPSKQKTPLKKKITPKKKI